MLVVFSAWIYPFELAFLRHLSWKLFLVENIVNSFFAIDIVLTFFLAYLDHKSYLLVDNPKRIAARLVLAPQLFSTVSFLMVKHMCKANNLNDTDMRLYTDISLPGSFLTSVPRFHINRLGYSLTSMEMALPIGHLTCFDYGVSDASVLYLPGMCLFII